MPTRTNAGLVGGIIEVDASVPLTPFIDAANQLVTELCAPSGHHTVERLEMIERYLSAHFYTLRDPRPVSEQVGAVQQTNQSKVDLFLSTSHYGQMAMVLDTSGALSDLNNQQKYLRVKRTISVTWVGSVCTPIQPMRALVIPDNQ